MAPVPKFYRSNVAGNRPTGRAYGEPYVNVADGQFGVVNGSNAAQDLIGVRYFSPTANYSANDCVVNAGVIYQANAAVTAGAFNPANWTALGAINPNRVDNGDMSIDQRNGGASQAAPANSGAWGVDRFWAYNGQATSRFNIGQNYPATIAAGPPGFPYFLGVQSTSAYTSAAAAQLYIMQGIEGGMVNDLGFGAAGAQSITVSFWARSSLTGNFSVAIQSGAPITTGSASYRCYITTYSLPTANTWTKIVLTIPGDTTIPAAWPGLYLIFDIGSGTTGQSATLNAWQSTPTFAASGAVHVTGTNNANWAITGVKLEAGTVATPYPVTSLSERLARCQRYCQVINNFLCYTPYAAAGYPFYSSGSLMTSMRTVPTAGVQAVSGVSNCTNATLIATDNSSFYLGATIVTAGAASLQANLVFSAEL